MDYILPVVAILILVVFVLGYIFLTYLKKQAGEKEIREQIKTLPIDFSHSGNVVFGPSGVWVLEIKFLTPYTTRPEKKIIKTVMDQASVIKNRIKDKLNTEVEVQPVLVLDNARDETKFGFFKAEGVYVIQRRWLDKLIREFPVENLDGITLDKIRELL